MMLRRTAGAAGATSVPFGVLPSRIAAPRRALVFSIVAVIWMVTLLAATRVAAGPTVARWIEAVSAAVYAMGNVICHQRPERSFQLWGAVMPVCARCTGIYLGAAVISLVMPLSTRTAMVQIASAAENRRTLLLAATPALVSLVYEWTTGDTPSNILRAVTGLVLGGGTAVVVWRTLSERR
jgi:uncharacterized membrane protein